MKEPDNIDASCAFVRSPQMSLHVLSLANTRIMILAITLNAQTISSQTAHTVMAHSAGAVAPWCNLYSHILQIQQVLCAGGF
jgi:hypothetical protein